MIGVTVIDSVGMFARSRVAVAFREMLTALVRAGYPWYQYQVPARFIPDLHNNIIVDSPDDVDVADHIAANPGDVAVIVALLPGSTEFGPHTVLARGQEERIVYSGDGERELLLEWIEKSSDALLAPSTDELNAWCRDKIIEELENITTTAVDALHQTETARRNEFDTYHRNRAMYGGPMDNPVAAAGATARITREEQERLLRLENEVQINWEDENTWATRSPSGEQWVYQISTMEEQHLWTTICWAVRNATTLYRLYVPVHQRHTDPLLGSRRWLSQQPAFQALIRAAVDKRVTFPNDVFSYIRSYVVTSPVHRSQPWKNPGAACQTEELRRSLAKQKMDNQFGGNRRIIDL